MRFVRSTFFVAAFAVWSLSSGGSPAIGQAFGQAFGQAIDQDASGMCSASRSSAGLTGRGLPRLQSSTSYRPSAAASEMPGLLSSGDDARGGALFGKKIGRQGARRGFDATYYHLDLTVDIDADPELYGRVRVRGQVNPGLSYVVLDLDSTMQVTGVLQPDGDALTFDHVADTLVIHGDWSGTADFNVFYEGTPAQTGFGAYKSGTRFQGDDYFWTLSEPYGARQWWPSNDHPSDKADSVRVSIRTSSHLVVGSNGLLQRRTDHSDGTTTWNWLHRYPIPTYLVSVTAGEYTLHEQTYERPVELEAEFGPLELPIQHFVYPGSAAFEGINDLSGWSRITDILKLFEDWYGPYPYSNEKYGHAHFTFRGGMEHATLSSMGNIGLGLMAHELAHQWFGDELTPGSWRDLWLNEGFATLGELLMWESDPVRFSSTYERIFDLYYNRALDAPGTLVLTDTTDVMDMFDSRRVYNKGWMVLRMLRGIVGDENFQAILRAYASSPQLEFGSVSTADFQSIVESVAGRSFDRFFSQWVTEGTGHPIYDVQWEDVSDSFGSKVRITLHQTQTPLESNVDVFHMPVWFRVRTEAGSRLVLIQNNARVQSQTYDLTSPPLSVTVDPEQWILHSTSETSTEADIPAAGASPRLTVEVAPNPTGGAPAAWVELPQSGKVQLQAYDMGGRRVAAWLFGPLPAGRHRLPLGSIEAPAGPYTLRIVTDRASAATSFVLIR